MAKRKRTKRIYYGPEGAETSMYWTVRVSRARKNVTIDGDVLHALKGYPGATVGCGLSNVAVDRANAAAFPHPVYLASFSKTAAWIVDKLDKAGQPAHAVHYEHSYGHITDANDKRTLKKLVKERPEVMSRPFTLRVPRNQKYSPPDHEPNRDGVSDGKPRGATAVHRGALLRAVKAGRIGKSVARQISDVAKQSHAG